MLDALLLLEAVGVSGRTSALGALSLSSALMGQWIAEGRNYLVLCMFSCHLSN